MFDKSGVVRRTYVRYIERTGEFYAAQGPYRTAELQEGQIDERLNLRYALAAGGA